MLLQPRAPALPEPLDEFESIYRDLLGLGITPPVADEMELWQIGSVLGLEGRDPVAVGSRSILLPKDRKGGKLPGSTLAAKPTPTMTPQIEARIEESRRRLAAAGSLPVQEPPEQ